MAAHEKEKEKRDDADVDVVHDDEGAKKILPGVSERREKEEEKEKEKVEEEKREGESREVKKVRAIEKDVIHKICSSQVIKDLTAVVKVKNASLSLSLDLSLSLSHHSLFSSSSAGVVGEQS